MTTNDQKLKETLADVFNLDAHSILDDASQDTIENWDSLNHLKLVLALESTFDVSFSEEQSVEILSLPLIREVLKEHGIQF